MTHIFHFATFAINFVVFLIQLILSAFSDKPSKYQFIEEEDVRGMPTVLLIIILFVFTEPLS